MSNRLIAAFALAALSIGARVPANAQQAAPQNGTETIILIRHGEKTAHELGQLNVRGLNRSLALPDVLVGKYGKPDYLFAPNPSEQIGSRDGGTYSYVRPLATIEPTAIKLGMTVNTQIGFTEIKQLEAELTKPQYANAVIFVAWEHGMEDQFAKNVMADYSKNASVVPDWPGKDFDSIFVIRLAHTGGTTTATFTLDHEGLDDKLTDTYPTSAH